MSENTNPDPWAPINAALHRIEMRQASMNEKLDRILEILGVPREKPIIPNTTGQPWIKHPAYGGDVELRR